MQTLFSADDCSKIGYIREDIEVKYKNKEINFKEYAILITTLLYAMDKIANTVGHYDAYRKNVDFEKPLVLNVLLPEKTINSNNVCYNLDANELIKTIKGIYYILILHITQDSIAMHIICLKILHDGRSPKCMVSQKRWIEALSKVIIV